MRQPLAQDTAAIITRPMTISQIADKMRCKTSTARMRVKAAIDAGLVETNGSTTTPAGYLAKLYDRKK